MLGAPTRVWDSGCPRECHSRDVGSNRPSAPCSVCRHPPTDAGAGLRSRRRRFDSCRVDHLAVAECSEAPGFYPGRRRLESCRRVQFVLPRRSTGRTPRSERGDRGSNPREAAKAACSKLSIAASSKRQDARLLTRRIVVRIHSPQLSCYSDLRTMFRVLRLRSSSYPKLRSRSLRSRLA